MSLIIADARLGVWKATDEGGPLTGVDCALEGPRLTCAGSACVCVGGNRECLCLTCHGLREISRMPAAPGLAALCLSPCGRYVYQLSSEADSVHTRLTATGDLIFAAPVGVFPRAMCLDASGRLLLAAGGAVDEAYLLTAPELVRERTIHTQSPCFARRLLARRTAASVRRRGRGYPHGGVYAGSGHAASTQADRPAGTAGRAVRVSGWRRCAHQHARRIDETGHSTGTAALEPAGSGAVRRPVLPRPHGAGERDAGRPGAAAFPLQAMAFKNRVYGYGCSCLLFDGIIRGRLAHP